ncbi:HIT family protein [Bdellovibrio sp. HCB337]|uniref:HIT family protein n=1 Tax=Bdellovibrio sp. HCB337 TaxID=3394358 RepID=UPI0039A6DBB6
MAKKKTASKSKKATKTKKASKPELFLKVTDALHSEVWPMERDVLFRPDRFKYVRKLVKPEGCVFCNAAKNEESFDTLCIYKSKHSMVVLNKFPYNSGHLLVIPLKHEGDLLSLSKDAHYDLHDTLRLAMKVLQDAYQPGGVNVGLNHGAAAGAGIPEHLHYHVIPRWAGDLNFFPLIAETKVVVESLEQTYDRLLGYFRKAR